MSLRKLHNQVKTNNISLQEAINQAYKLGLNEQSQNKPKIGDYVLVMRARTSGGGSFKIKVTKIGNGNKVSGIIQSGPLAGTTESGVYLRHINSF